MAGDINRVTLVGRLTRDPELRHPPSGTLIGNGPRRERASAGRRRQLGRQTQLLRRQGLRKPGRDALAASRKGAPRRHRRPPRLALWEAQDGTKRSKVDVVAQVVQFLDSRQDGEAAAYVPAGAAASGDDFPTSPADDDIPF